MELSVGDIAHIVDGVALGTFDARPRRAVHDSRLVEPGDLFVALKGEQTDGHRFLVDAFHRGAVAALISEPVALPEEAPSAVVVDCPLRALQTLAAAWRDRLSGRVIGITGSFGKTTTRALLAHVLRETFATHEAPANYNSEIGLPLALLEMSVQDQAGVFELGTENPGDIALLSSILRPTAALVTGIGPSHLAQFGSLKAIVREKWALIEALPDEGMAIVNGDDPYLLDRARTALRNIFTVGVAEGDLRASEVRAAPFLELDLTVPPMTLRTRLLGQHNATNVLLASACAKALAVPERDIERRVASFPPVPHRLELHETQELTLIDDTYNANPAAMRAALDVLASCGHAGSHRLFVYGEMRDLGPSSDGAHQDIARHAQLLGIDRVLPVGDMPERACRSLPQKMVLAGVSRELLPDLIRQQLRGSEDVVLIKGSRALGLDEVVDRLLDSGDGTRRLAA